jgi:hypothetical protein
MADNNINPTPIVTAIVSLLTNDATLQGVTYLNGTNKVYSRRAPNNAVCNYLVVEPKEVFENGIFQFKGEFRVHSYTALLANGQIDPAGDAIIYRCQELLNDQFLTISGMSTMPLRVSVVPSYFDAEADESKAHGVLRLNVESGYN